MNTIKSTIHPHKLQQQERLIQQICSQGYLFLDTEDGEIWIVNAPPAAVVAGMDQLTFPRLSKLLEQRKINGELTVLTIISEQEILALAVLRAHTVQHCEILSFWVHPRWRGQGYDNLLLNQVELLCLKNGLQYMTMDYRTYWQSAKVRSEMLVRKGWSEQETLMYYAITPYQHQSDWEQLFAAPWFKRVSIPSSFDIKSATPQRLTDLIASWQKTGDLQNVPMALHPTQLLSKLDETASIIAYQKDYPVGWCLVHRLQTHLWQCTTLYVLPEFRSRLGLSIGAEMARRHQCRGNINFMIQPDNRLMLAFSRRHLQATGTTLERLVRMEKRLP